MTRTKTAFMVLVSFAALATILIAIGETRSARAAGEPAPVATPTSMPSGAQEGCPIIFPDGPVVVAPNQPAVENQSTIGIINALCDVTLDFIGCGFRPTSIALGCDSNGDAVPDISIPLKDIKAINGVLIQATLPALATTPGSAFPLVCCGGQTTITLSRTVSAGDDNIFGPYTQTITCSIDLGIRAPVVISASPSDGDCSIGQNLLIAGACFVLADGKPNVTSVFAVEAGNPNNVIQASAIQVLSASLIDAFFQFGPSSAGRAFLIYASGPNGTSRNLTELPPSVPADCPLGNEQGVKVTFNCKSTNTSGGGSGSASIAVLNACRVDRDDAGMFVLSVFGKGIREGATLTVGGAAPKKVKLRDPDPIDHTFTRLTARKKFCSSLPGAVIITNPDGTSSTPLLCNERCLNQ